MGNGTKAALVALLIVMVVVVAKFVNTASTQGQTPDAVGENTPGGDGESDAGAERGSEGAELASSRGNGSTARGASGRGPAGANMGSGGPRLMTQDTPNRPIRRRAPAPSARSNGGGNFRPIAQPGTSGAAVGTTPNGAANAGSANAGASSAGGEGTRFLDSRTPRSLGNPSAGHGNAPVSVAELKRQEAEKRARLERVREERDRKRLLSQNLGNASSSDPNNGNLAVRNLASGGTPATGAAPGTAAPGTATHEPIGGVVGRGRPGVNSGTPKPVVSSAATSPASGGATTREQTYVLQSGESPWAVAQKFYKAGILNRVIIEANPGSKFHAGEKIVVPALSEAERAAKLSKFHKKTTTRDKPSVATTARRSGTPRSTQLQTRTGAAKGLREYKVKKGDTLSGLAQRFLGSASRIDAIEKANSNLEFTGLIAGSTIKIPAR